MGTIKHSRQREAIKNYLMQTNEHPTADTVYRYIRNEYPNISLGTVYRNLNLLAQQGEILKIDCQDGCDHFDGNVKPHNHFLCTRCGRVLDLDMESIDYINEIAGANFAGKIEGHEMFFYGVCPNCINEDK
jgi:Fur family peroxide stress response transcriptional regulator